MDELADLFGGRPQGFDDLKETRKDREPMKLRLPGLGALTPILLGAGALVVVPCLFAVADNMKVNPFKGCTAEQRLVAQKIGRYCFSPGGVLNDKETCMVWMSKANAVNEWDTTLAAGLERSVVEDVRETVERSIGHKLAEPGGEPPANSGPFKGTW